MLENKRLENVDIIKGFLVITMIVYHCVISDNPELLRVKNSIPFIHSSFLIIAGFICGYHYWPRINQNARGIR